MIIIVILADSHYVDLINRPLSKECTRFIVFKNLNIIYSILQIVLTMQLFIIQNTDQCNALNQVFQDLQKAGVPKIYFLGTQASNYLKGLQFSEVSRNRYVTHFGQKSRTAMQRPLVNTAKLHYQSIKGQLISECLFEKIVWTKIPTKNLIDSAQQRLLLQG